MFVLGKRDQILRVTELLTVEIIPNILMLRVVGEGMHMRVVEQVISV